MEYHQDDCFSSSESDNEDDDEFFESGDENWDVYTDRDRNHERDGRLVWIFSPRSLKSLCALQFILCGKPSMLEDGQIPAASYYTLLCEALRLQSPSFIPYLISRWPLHVLDFNHADLSPDRWTGQLTRTLYPGLSLVDLVIRGLLLISSESRLERVIMPVGNNSLSASLKVFSRLPLLALKDVPYFTMKQWLFSKLGNSIDFLSYLKEMKSLSSIDSRAFPPIGPGTRTKTITLCGPAVVQWRGGSKKNIRDVLVALALQDYAPFNFMFDRIILKNAIQPLLIAKLFQLIQDKEEVKQVLVYNWPGLGNQPGEFSMYWLPELTTQLQEFPSIQSFMSQYEGLKTNNVLSIQNIRQTCLRCSEVFSKWHDLQELNLSGHSLKGGLTILLQGLASPLVNMNLSTTNLIEEDIRFLANSTHVTKLAHLNLDYNDLSTPLAATCELFANLKCIVTLRTCGARLNYKDAISLATALITSSSSRTMRRWNLLQNEFGTLCELEDFITKCREMTSLQDIGCMPFELHALIGTLHIHTTGPPTLQDSENKKLMELAKALRLRVF